MFLVLGFAALPFLLLKILKKSMKKIINFFAAKRVGKKYPIKTVYTFLLKGITD